MGTREERRAAREEGRPVERATEDRTEEEKAGEREVVTHSRNLPPLSARDLLAMAIGTVGTIVLFILAAACGDETLSREGPGGACFVRLVLAIFFFVITVQSVLALLLFQSTRYRGMWERFFSAATLFGTPLAVALSLLVTEL